MPQEMSLLYREVRALSSIDSFPFCNPSFRSATVKNHRSSGADGCRCALTLWTGRFLGSHHRPERAASNLRDTRVTLVCLSEVL